MSSTPLDKKWFRDTRKGLTLEARELEKQGQALIKRASELRAARAALANGRVK